MLTSNHNLSLSKQEMIMACTHCDSSYNGKFYLGVLSTMIYCLPSCKAKMPLEKNIKFFKFKEEAISHGLRGCKRCHSGTYPDVEPQWLKQIKDYLKNNLNTKLNESDVIKLVSVDISTVRRYFKTHYNQTVMAYHRTLRLLHAKILIELGTDHAVVPYMVGYESLSGFRDAFKREFGVLPGEFSNEAKNLL